MLTSMTGTHGACGKHAHLQESVIVKLRPTILQANIKAQYWQILWFPKELKIKNQNSPNF